MMRTYWMYYYIPNQSHLFSDPKCYHARGKEQLTLALDLARKNGYDIVEVFYIDEKGNKVTVER